MREKERMTLFAYMDMHQEDIDTYDTEYDAVVTVCYMEEENAQDNYDRFCLDIIKKVEVDSAAHGNVIVDWSGLIERNMEKFRAFTAKYWRYQYEDDDEEFVYQWIREINYYLAGYVGEDTYCVLNEFLQELD